MIRQPMAEIDLNDADQAILEILTDGRNLATNIASETGYTRQYITTRLKRLREHDYVENIGSGLYEITNEGEDRLTGAE